MTKGLRGFSLLETVIAIGLVAGGALVLFGLLSPLLQAVDHHEWRRRAKSAADAVIAHLEALGIDRAIGQVVVNEADVAALGDWDERKLFVDREGERVGTFAEIAARSYERLDQACFFEAMVVRNSVSGRWDESGVMGVTLLHLELTWPAGAEDGSAVPRRDRSRLRVIMSLRR